MLHLSAIRGDLTATPRLRTTGSGHPYRELRLIRPGIARHDGTGGYLHEPTLEIRALCWGDLVEDAAVFRRGDRVLIECGDVVQPELTEDGLVLRVDAKTVTLAPREPRDDEPTADETDAAAAERLEVTAVRFSAAQPAELIAAA